MQDRPFTAAKVFLALSLCPNLLCCVQAARGDSSVDSVLHRVSSSHFRSFNKLSNRVAEKASNRCQSLGSVLFSQGGSQKQTPENSWESDLIKQDERLSHNSCLSLGTAWLPCPLSWGTSEPSQKLSKRLLNTTTTPGSRDTRGCSSDGVSVTVTKRSSSCHCKGRSACEGVRDHHTGVVLWDLAQQLPAITKQPATVWGIDTPLHATSCLVTM